MTWLVRAVRKLCGIGIRWAYRQDGQRVTPLAGGRVDRAQPAVKGFRPCVLPFLVVRETLDRQPLHDHHYIYASMGWLVKARTRAEAASTVLDLWLQEPQVTEDF